MSPQHPQTAELGAGGSGPPMGGIEGTRARSCSTCSSEQGSTHSSALRCLFIIKCFKDLCPSQLHGLLRQGLSGVGASGGAWPAVPSHGKEDVNGDVGQGQAVAPGASPQLPVGREKGEGSSMARSDPAPHRSPSGGAQHPLTFPQAARHPPAPELLEPRPGWDSHLPRWGTSGPVVFPGSSCPGPGRG